MAMVTPPWWPLLSPWISPGAAWFVFFNAVVAAIAVMSSSAQQEQDGHLPMSSRRRLCRSASSGVLDQLRSFSLFSVHSITAGGVTVPSLDDLAACVSDSDYSDHCSKEAEPVPARQVINEVVMVTETTKSTAPVAGVGVPAAAPDAAPGAPVETAAATDESVSAPKSKQEAADAEEEQDKSISMDEAYAMVQQLRRPLQAPSIPTAASVATTTKHRAAKGPTRRRRRKAEEAAPEGKAELNARAELFIRQFREELKLQRLNSLLRHTQALGPRDGAPTAVR